jgi:peptidoglycan/LPS O-acetylase OafA/YrhL
VNRLPGLDLLRSIAIVWVMLFHSFIVGGLGPDFEWLSRFGWAGVDIFGFPLLAWWLGRRPSLPKFGGLCIALLLMGAVLRAAVWLHDASLHPPRNWFSIYATATLMLGSALFLLVERPCRSWREGRSPFGTRLHVASRS